MKDEVIVSTRIERRYRDALVARAREFKHDNLSQYLRSVLKAVALGSIEESSLVYSRIQGHSTHSASDDPLDTLINQLSRKGGI